MTTFETVKQKAANFISYGAENLLACPTIYLAIASTEKPEQVVRQRLEELNESQKNEVYGKVWELAKMQDPTINGNHWGEHHAFDNIERLSKALHRLGFLEKDHLHPLKCLPFSFGKEESAPNTSLWVKSLEKIL